MAADLQEKMSPEEAEMAEAEELLRAAEEKGGREEVEEVEDVEDVEEEGQEIEGVEGQDETAEDLDGAKDGDRAVEDEIDEDEDEINQPELQGEEAGNEEEEEEAHEEEDKAEEEEVQVPEEVEEVREEGTFEEEAWEGDYQAEEYVEDPPDLKQGSRNTSNGKTKESWPSLPARPAPRRWTGRPAQAEANGKSSPTVAAAAYTNGAGGDHDDLHSQLRQLEDENEELRKELSNEKMRVKQLQKLQVEAAQANHREFEAKKREASALRDLDEAKSYVARRHTFALNEKAELLQKIQGLEKQLQEAKDREVALNLEAQEANQARADVSVEQEDFKKEADHWRKDAAEQAARLKSAEQRLHQLEQRKLEDKAKIKALAEQLQAAVDSGFVEGQSETSKRPGPKPASSTKQPKEVGGSTKVASASIAISPPSSPPVSREVRIAWSFGWLCPRRPAQEREVTLPKAAPKPQKGKEKTSNKTKGKKPDKVEKKVEMTDTKVDEKDEVDTQKTQHAILAFLVLFVLGNAAWALKS